MHMGSGKDRKGLYFNHARIQLNIWYFYFHWACATCDKVIKTLSYGVHTEYTDTSNSISGHAGSMPINAWSNMWHWHQCRSMNLNCDPFWINNRILIRHWSVSVGIDHWSSMSCNMKPKQLLNCRPKISDKLFFTTMSVVTYTTNPTKFFF